MKKIILMALLCLLLIPCRAFAEENEMKAELTQDYGQLNITTENPEGTDSLRVCLVSEGEILTSTSAQGTYYRALDFLAYYCQSNPMPETAHFLVQALKGEEVIAEAETESFRPADFYPEKKELHFEEDVKLEDVTAFSWQTNGMYVEAFNSFSLYEKDGVWRIEAEYYTEKGQHREINRKMKPKEVEQLKQLLAKGYLKRKSTMDPEIIILDGGTDEMRVSWKDMGYRNRLFYLFCPADRKEMTDWLYSLHKGNLLLLFGAGGISLVLISGLALFHIKKK